MFLDTIDRDLAERIVEYLRASDATMRVAQIRVLGGSMARVPAEATAFAAALRQQGKGGASVNFLDEEGEGRVREAYSGSTWERLAAIKGRYDPTNLFRLSQNIPPSSGARTTEQKEPTKCRNPSRLR
jgi:hypothetical protein